MVDILGAIKKGIDKGVEQGEKNIVRDLTRTATGEVTKMGKEVAGQVTGAFKDKAAVSAAVNGLPDKFDPRESPNMSRAIEQLLVGAGARGVTANNTLDGKDLAAFNGFLKQQGSKPIESWEDVKKKDVARLVDVAAERNSPAYQEGITALNAGVKEASGTAATPASGPSSGPDVGAAVGNVAEGAANVATKGANAVSDAFSWLKKKANEPRPNQGPSPDAP